MFYPHGVMGPCGFMSDNGLRPYWASRVKKQFGKNHDVDAFNRVEGMAQATRWVSPLEDFFSDPRTPPNCIGCALPIIGFPIVFGKFGKKNYEPSS